MNIFELHPERLLARRNLMAAVLGPHMRVQLVECLGRRVMFHSQYTCFLIHEQLRLQFWHREIIYFDLVY